MRSGSASIAAARVHGGHMIRRVDIGLAPNREPLGNPTPLGLIGLAIACGALTPIAFGLAVTKSALITGAMFAILFGAGC